MDEINNVGQANYLLKRLLDDGEILVGLTEEELIRLEQLVNELSNNLEKLSSENLVASCRDFIDCVLEMGNFKQILEEAKTQLRFKGYDLSDSEVSDISCSLQENCKNVITFTIKKAREERLT